MSNLQLTLACGDYDRTRALEDGTVRPDGIDLTYLRLPVEETFFRMMRHQEFDISEMSLSSYVLSLQQESPPFIAIPVFTSRMFRHGAIYVNTAAGIDSPADLAGRRVGTPEFQLTAGVWVRGILADDYGVPVASAEYLVGGQETAGRIEKAKVTPPAGVRVSMIPRDRTLSEMLATGEIDALYSPRIPGPMLAGDRRIRRLFDDVVAEEKAYFERTRIFPIMHVVVVRRSVYERHPWVAQSLQKAFTLAKQRAYDAFSDTSALRFMLPWMTQAFEESVSLIGADVWSYGISDENERVLSTFLRYHKDQGLSKSAIDARELFAPETLESFLI